MIFQWWGISPAKAAQQEAGGFPPVPSGGWVMEYTGAQHVLQSMLMAFPDQAGSLQGPCRATCSALAANDPGNGSGWQQSKQNWAVPAVVGHWARMLCSDLWWV